MKTETNDDSKTHVTENKDQGFLKDSDGKPSAMRLMNVIALFASIFFGWVTVKTDNENGVFITVAFLLAAFAPKALQKFIENSPRV